MKTVAIVGSHPKTRALFDFSRTDCAVWVFNEALADPSGWCKRADAVFQMHLPAIWKNPNNRNDPNHGAWLMAGNTPEIIMQEQYAEVPQATRFPIEQARALFPYSYFTSSMCYAISLAILRGYERIEVYGVELETDTEYRYQREGFTLWMGIAAGRGLEVEYHGTIFDAPLYGYEGEAHLSYDTFTGRITEIANEVTAQMQIYEQARQASDDAMLKFNASGREDHARSVPETVTAWVKAAYDFGVVDGARQENQRYERKATEMIRAANDFKFSRQEFEHSAQATYKEFAKFKERANELAGACNVLFSKAMTERNAAKRRKRMGEFANVVGEYVKCSLEAGLYFGAHRENILYMQKLDTLIKAAGGSKSEAVLLGVNANG